MIYFVFFLFFDMFCHDGLILKALGESSNSCKIKFTENTPNTMSKRPSKLIISVLFDDFYGLNQTFWCNIVGVFLIETHKHLTFAELFSKGFCMARLFIFWKIMIFVMNCTWWFKIFCVFCFQKYTIRNKNRCENGFHFFVLSVNAFEKPTFDDEKTVKIWVFTFLINFPSLKNRFPDISF